MNKNQKGFTIIELITVVALIGILAAISLPYWRDWAENAKYKDAVRKVAAALRDARSKAIAENREYDVQFDIDNHRYWMTQGATTVVDYGTFPPNLKMATGTACANTTGDSTVASDNKIQFNPNGTSGSSGGAGSPYVCILDEKGQRKYKAGVTSTTTGRIAIFKRNAADTDWQ